MKKFLSLLLAFAIVCCFMPCRVSALSASSAVVINGDTGEIIYSNNPFVKRSMASTTKIMTALVLCESGDLAQKVTITAPMVAVEGSSMGLRVGDVVTLRDLLYGLMLPSGNDAANAIAIALTGSIDAFAKKMNEKAQELGLKSTHFVTPSGLDAEEHYTTAYELALITKCAMENEDFADVVSTSSITLDYGGASHYLKNHNRLLTSVEGVIGVKTGFTKKSGRCLVSAYKKDGKYIITVTLNDPNDWADHKELIEIGVGAIKQITLTPSVKKATVFVIGGNIKSIEIPFDNADAFLVSEENIRCSITIPQVIYAPQKKGEKIGELSYYKDDTLVFSQDVFIPCSIKETKYNNSKMLLIIFKQILSEI